jgi:predicted enzyme related to lactoylglutathione lyase
VSIQGIFYLALHVSDLSQSKSFYGDRLGWKLETDEPAVAGFRFGDGYVVLLARETVAVPSAGGVQVAVKVTDIDVEYAKLKNAGVSVDPLVSQPWGERSFGFRDPDGYEWSYGEIVHGA